MREGEESVGTVVSAGPDTGPRVHPELPTGAKGQRPMLHRLSHPGAPQRFVSHGVNAWGTRSAPCWKRKPRLRGFGSVASVGCGARREVAGSGTLEGMKAEGGGRACHGVRKDAGTCAVKGTAPVLPVSPAQRCSCSRGLSALQLLSACRARQAIAGLLREKHRDGGLQVGVGEKMLAPVRVPVPIRGILPVVSVFPF